MAARAAERKSVVRILYGDLRSFLLIIILPRSGLFKGMICKVNSDLIIKAHLGALDQIVII